ncbi:DUF4383 domain-containing protein [Frigoribacterium salinisoli]
MSSPVVSSPAVAAPRSPNRGIGVLFGALFVALGVCGFFVFPLGTFFDTEGGELLWLGINPAHVFLWIISGAALVIAGTAGVGSARTINAWVGAPMLVLGVVGLFVRGTDLNLLAFTIPSALLWIAAGALLLLTAVGADRPRGTVARRS